MVHILKNEAIDTDLMAMLYNMLSQKDPVIYLVCDSIYRVPHWERIIERAQYWFSEVHIVLGQPWFLRIDRMEDFDSVNIYLADKANSIFTPVISEYGMKPSKLKTHTTVINGKKQKKSFYKEFLQVDEVRDDLPFAISSILIDDNLQVYNSIESRLGDF